MLHPNGTWFMVCDGTRLITAPSAYGPWRTVSNLNPGSGGVPGTYEDPFLFVDARGNWHVIYVRGSAVCEHVRIVAVRFCIV